MCLLEAHQFSPDEFLNIIAKYSRNIPQAIQNKTQFKYFCRYLRDIGCTTIIVEPDYTDHDYMVDFSSYYVSCFPGYHCRCTRLHFFKNDLNEDDIKNLLLRKNESITLDTLKKNYLGFMVIKPLPRTFIGRTCVRTYEEDQGRRVFPLRRSYKAHPFGIPLIIENTIAFQEQDRVLGACATSALYSVFQCTGKLFQHKIPAPVEITNAATESFQLDMRAFPNRGLSSEQMACAIRHVGLEPLPIQAKHNFLLKAAVYAYLKCGIPAILMLEIPRINGEGSEMPPYKHAIAVTGFSIIETDLTLSEDSMILLKSSQINKIYVHDDQVGPFAKMEFVNNNLSTSFGCNGSDSVEILARPFLLLVPLYHKIRISLQNVLYSIYSFEDLLRHLGEQLGRDTASVKPIWDVYLSDSNNYKNEISNNYFINDNDRIRYLTENAPRFLWIAKASINKDKIIDLIYDATDIEQSAFIFKTIPYDEDYFNAIKDALSVPEVIEEVKSKPCWIILEKIYTELHKH